MHACRTNLTYFCRQAHAVAAKTLATFSLRFALGQSHLTVTVTEVVGPSASSTLTIHLGMPCPHLAFFYDKKGFGAARVTSVWVTSVCTSHSSRLHTLRHCDKQRRTSVRLPLDQFTVYALTKAIFDVSRRRACCMQLLLLCQRSRCYSCMTVWARGNERHCVCMCVHPSSNDAVPSYCLQRICAFCSFKPQALQLYFIPD